MPTERLFCAMNTFGPSWGRNSGTPDPSSRKTRQRWEREDYDRWCVGSRRKVRNGTHTRESSVDSRGAENSGRTSQRITPRRPTRQEVMFDNAPMSQDECRRESTVSFTSSSSESIPSIEDTSVSGRPTDRENTQSSESDSAKIC